MGVAGDVVAGRQVNLLQAADETRKIDILFMIDNSGSMSEEQAQLAQNFPALVSSLAALPGGLPDLHIAVVSSDFGAGQTVRDNCRPYGDAGRFLVKPNCGLDPGQARFLAVDGRGNKNFAGELPAVFACLANLGITGCGLEHQLQAVRAALSTVHPENQGFLRPDAHLAIVLLTDEDDCSAEPDATLFDAARPGEALSFRCNVLGHVCDGRPIPAEDWAAPLATCKPYQRSAAERATRLINVEELVDFIKALKPGRPDQILVSAVIGWETRPDAQYRVARVSQGELDVQPICASAGGRAAPGVRLKAFADAFGPNGSVHSICDRDFTPALRTIGNALAFKLGNTCVDAALQDVDPAREGLQAECQVVERIPRNATSYAEQRTPACGAGQMPCWELAPDPACPGGQRLRINRATPASPGTLVAASCRGLDLPKRNCGNVPCPVPPVLAGLGEICDSNAPPPIPPGHALWRADTGVCAAELCVKPAQDPLLGRAVDTAALCTVRCGRDSDCAGAVMRNRSNLIDKRCNQGFACGVAFETGPLRCERLCLCKDFLTVPPAGLPTPLSCATGP